MPSDSFVSRTNVFVSSPACEMCVPDDTNYVSILQSMHPCVTLCMCIVQHGRLPDGSGKKIRNHLALSIWWEGTGNSQQSPAYLNILLAGSFHTYSDTLLQSE